MFFTFSVFFISVFLFNLEIVVCTVIVDDEVVPYYLEDCWKWAVSKETVMKDAELRIEQIKAETFCENCGKVYGTVEHGKICPYCGSDRTYLKQGNEFILKNIVAGDCESCDKTE